MAKRNWIQTAIKNPGAFSAKAKKAGMGTMEFARKKHRDPVTERQANLAKELMSFNHKGKSDSESRSEDKGEKKEE